MPSIVVSTPSHLLVPQGVVLSGYAGCAAAFALARRIETTA